jgi:hypothetical protein
MDKRNLHILILVQIQIQIQIQILTRPKLLFKLPPLLGPMSSPFFSFLSTLLFVLTIGIRACWLLTSIGWQDFGFIFQKKTDKTLETNVLNTCENVFSSSGAEI